MPPGVVYNSGAGGHGAPASNKVVVSPAPRHVSPHISDAGPGDVTGCWSRGVVRQEMGLGKEIVEELEKEVELGKEMVEVLGKEVEKLRGKW
ncbi:hypothetical protein Pcinc_027727 [Petrolisthes cinctipes]|uniref:Uncharacterized protein n=1 Tax=Petrolisthes cinctipes TaxID=88211 RepID=A0AAE1K890_PETCI|nr:hypothetical protein Pcinc_027727 [Petrolisthes cinctipes]